MGWPLIAGVGIAAFATYEWFVKPSAATLAATGAAAGAAGVNGAVLGGAGGIKIGDVVSAPFGRVISDDGGTVPFSPDPANPTSPEKILLGQLAQLDAISQLTPQPALKIQVDALSVPDGDGVAGILVDFPLVRAKTARASVTKVERNGVAV